MTGAVSPKPGTAAADVDARYAPYISQALATEGGHLSIGRGGYTLYYTCGARPSSHDCEAVKAACVAAGLPVIDSRRVTFATVYALAVRGPMVAVGEPADPLPWGPFSYAPLTMVAEAYRAAGAEVLNLPRAPRSRPGE